MKKYDIYDGIIIKKIIIINNKKKFSYLDIFIYLIKQIIWNNVNIKFIDI